MGRLLAARPDPAVVLVPGRRGAAVLDRRPRWRGGSRGRGMTLHAFWRALVLVVLGHLPAVGGPAADELHVRGHAHADRPGLRLPVPAGLPPGARPVGRARRSILVGYWAAFALYPRRHRTSTTPRSACPPTGRTTLTGFAAHWDKNANLAWAFDTWFLNLFPRDEPFALQRRRLRDPELHPDARHDDPRPDRRRRAARRPAGRGRKVAWLVVGGRRRPGWRAGRSARLGVCPVVKRIWTPSWVLFSGGWCFLLLAAFYAVVDVARLARAGRSRWSSSG